MWKLIKTVQRAKPPIIMHRQKSINHVSEQKEKVVIQSRLNIKMKLKILAKSGDNERDGAADDKGITKQKVEVEKDGRASADASDKKNNTVVSKTPRTKVVNRKNNDETVAPKKADGSDNVDAADIDEDNAEEKQPSGIPLGDIGKIEKYIAGTRVEGLQTLHQICLDVVGKTNLLKKNLRQFSGFNFEKASPEYEKKLKDTQKFDLAKLKGVCEGLQLDKKGSKEAVSQRICEFLLAPSGVEADDDDKNSGDEDEEEEEVEEEEEEPPSEDDKAKRKRVGRPATTGSGRNAREEKVSKGGRPRRSTAGRGKADLSSYVEYSSSDEDEKFTKKQAVKRKRGGDDSDSGSDVSIQL